MAEDSKSVGTAVASNLPAGMAFPKLETGSEDFVKVDPLKIKLIDCRVLCKVVDYGNMSSGGIVLPRGSDDKQSLTVMKVISIGDGRTTDHGVHIEVRVKPGDYVIVGKYAGLKVGPSSKTEYKILNEVEILGVQEVEV
jgi:chaperonin GroES